MKFLPKLTALAMLCGTLAMGSGQALAASNASVTMGPLSIMLVDLNPLDDITPSISFVDSEWWYGVSYTQASVQDYGAGTYDSSYDTATTAWMSSSSTAAIPGTWAAASITGNGAPTGTTISASGSTQGTLGGDSYAYYSADANLPGYYYYGGTFTLSDNTAVIFSAAISGDVSVTGSFDPSVIGGSEHASVSGNLNVWGSGAGGNGSQNASDYFSLGVSSQAIPDANAIWGYVYGPDSAAGNQSLAAAFVNVSGANLDGYMQMNVNANGYSYVAAVPEPETYAMLLAGLGVIGAVARRRRQHAA